MRPRGEAATRLVGAWRLVETSDPDRRGPRPTGLVMYDARGNMSVQIMPDKPRPEFAGSRPTPEEAQTALSGYTAYFGRCTVDEVEGTVTHHRTGNVDPGGLGDFVRRYEFVGDERVILRPLENNNVLVRERVEQRPRATGLGRVPAPLRVPGPASRPLASIRFSANLVRRQRGGMLTWS
jgi:hypothetical protein